MGFSSRRFNRRSNSVQVSNVEHKPKILTLDALWRMTGALWFCTICVLVVLNFDPQKTNLDWNNVYDVFRLHGPKRIDKLATLIEENDMISARSSRGWTLLHLACFDLDKDAIRLLIERGARPNLLTKDGWTAADIAEQSASVWRQLDPQKASQLPEILSILNSHSLNQHPR